MMARCFVQRLGSRNLRGDRCRGTLHAVAGTAGVHSFPLRVAVTLARVRREAFNDHDMDGIDLLPPSIGEVVEDAVISTINFLASTRRPNQLQGTLRFGLTPETRIASSQVQSFVAVPHATLPSARQNFDRREAVHTAETYSADSAV
jgi:hypothetical protein